MEVNAMRKTIGALLCMALVWTAAGAWAAVASYRLQVDGLACPFCAYGIEKKLTALEELIAACPGSGALRACSIMEALQESGPGGGNGSYPRREEQRT